MNNANTVHMEIEGELSIFNAIAVRDRMLESIEKGDEIEVDLAKVDEIDSAGVQLMVAAKREATRRNKPLRFVGHSPAVLDIVDLCDLSGHFGDPMLIQPRA